MNETYVIYTWTAQNSIGESRYRIVEYNYENHPNQIAIEVEVGSDWDQLASFTDKQIVYKAFKKMAMDRSDRTYPSRWDDGYSL